MKRYFVILLATCLHIGVVFAQETLTEPTTVAQEINRDVVPAIIITLPSPDFNGKTVEQAIRERRSVRSFASEPVTLKQVSQLLFAAQGITRQQGAMELRSAPSAGALYPMETYLVADRVEGLEPGVYKYLIDSHSLKLLLPDKHMKELAVICYNQMFMADASCAIVLTAVPSRTIRKYTDRGLRYIYMEAGHISENIYLQAVSLDLGTVAVGAFRDSQLKSLLTVTAVEETPLYLNVIGVPDKE